MSVLSTLGLTSKKIRYGLVALGDITQEAMLPGIAHTGNSEVTAFVTDDPEKAAKLGKMYGVEHSFRYDEFAAFLTSGLVDAIYLATPNWRHAEFAVPALRAGIHVLVEKPIEVTIEKTREIIAAQQASGAKLMVAYRLHFERGTLNAIDRIRSGDLGDLVSFTSVFTQMVSPDNHRAKYGDLAGPVLDMGPYPVNAARMMFGAEPEMVVSAAGSRHPQAGFGEFDDTVAVTLRFPGGRLAQFTISYYGNAAQAYTVVGTKGTLQMDPAYMYGKSLEQTLTLGEKETSASFKNTDHFGGQMKYFSDCILKGRDPEPDGEEGYADMRVLDGILRALKSGRSETLEPFTRTKRIDTKAQRETLAAVASPPLVNTSNPGRDKDKVSKN